MVRSYWKGALVLTLAWASVAQGQQAASPPLGASAPDGIVTVQEMGKPMQRCRILSSWPVGDGNTAYLVQDLETTKTWTIVDGPTAGSVKITPESTARPVVQASETQSAPAPTGTTWSLSGPRTSVPSMWANTVPHWWGFSSPTTAG